MKRNIKALGLALLAAFAMSAVAASAAQAEAAQFTAPAYPTVGTGVEVGETGTNFFETTPGRQLHCSTVSYEGTLAGASSELSVRPHYDNCVATIPGSEPTVQVHLNGCSYLFTAGTKVTHGSSGSVHVKCPANKQITITILTCTVHIPEQSPTGGITFTNASGKVTVDVNVTDIKATETDGFLCPFEGDTNVTDGKFVSHVTFSGFADLGTHAGKTTTRNSFGSLEEQDITTATEGAARNIDVG